MTEINPEVVGDYKAATKNGTEPINRMSNVRLYQYLGTIGQYFAGEQPDIMLGVIPLYNVVYYEISRAYGQLRFKSVDTNYYAQQQGGNVGIRIDLKLTEPLKDVYLASLHALMMWGKQQENVRTPPKLESEEDNALYNYKKVDTKASLKARTGVNNLFVSWGNYISFKGQTKNPKPLVFEYFDVDVAASTKTGDFNSLQIEERTTADDIKARVDPNIVSTVPNNLTYNRQYWHKTFTLLTEDNVKFDCYIQTITFHREATDKNVIYASLLVRQFTPPPVWKDADQKLVVYRYYKNNSRIRVARVIKTKDTFSSEDNVDFRSKKSIAAGKAAKTKGIFRLKNLHLETMINVLHRTVMAVKDIPKYKYIFNTYITNNGYKPTTKITGE